MTSTNLPTERTSFVGRGAELAELRRLFAAGARLVTLTGAGGTGKTRLALRYAAEASEDFTGAGGVWLCDASEARSPSDLESVIGRVLQVPLADRQAQGTQSGSLGHAVAARGKVLLLLDNVEQIVEPTRALLHLWLDIAPSALFLVTSRERLRIAGEQCFEVEPLSIPAPREVDLPAIEAHDSVTLFVQRASLVRPSYRLTPADAPAVAEIVRRLDGLPLAIELCAARTAVLGASELLSRLATLQVLAEGPALGIDRHQTLRRAIDGSWVALEPREKQALTQCATFRGGWTLEAAERVLVLPPPEGGADAASTLAVMQSLHDKSLVRVEDAHFPGEKRYRLYESIRDYALERLEDRDGAERRHLAWFVELGKRWRDRVDEHEGTSALRRLVEETDNFLAAHSRALAWAQDSRRPEGHLEALAADLDILLALEPIFITRGPASQFLLLVDGWIEAATVLGAPAALEARALSMRGRMENFRAGWANATRDFERALALAEAAGETSMRHYTLTMLVGLFIQQGSVAEAERCFERAREAVAAAGDAAAAGLLARHHGTLLKLQGRADEAVRRYHDALASARRRGNRREQGALLMQIGMGQHQREQLDDAKTSCEQALAIADEFGDRRMEAFAFGILAEIEQEQGRFDAARLRLERVLRIVRETGDRYTEALARGGLGTVAHERGDLPEACEHYAAALALFEDIGDPRRRGIILARMALADAGTAWGAELRDARLDEAARLVASSGSPSEQRAVALLAAVRLDEDARRRAGASAGDGRRPTADERVALRLLGRAVGARVPLATGAESGTSSPAVAPLFVDANGRWFQHGEAEKVDLSRRRAFRLLLLALVQRRLDAPDGALGVEELLAAGWPGERVQAEAGAHRVYAALSALRDLGLRGVLLKRDDGYLLDPRVELRRRDEI